MHNGQAKFYARVARDRIAMRVFMPTRLIDPDAEYISYDTSYDYAWPSTIDAYIDYDHFEQGYETKSGSVHVIGPEIVRVLERNIYRSVFRVIRERPFSRLRWWRWKLRRGLGEFNMRLLETARVWGLASWEWGEAPSWRQHCKLFRGHDG
jgi:hypothetical protein